MKLSHYLMLCLFALLSVSGHTSTKIEDQQYLVTGKVPKPAHIWVYDFAATAADLPPESTLAGIASSHDTPQTPEQIDTGRKVGAEIAQELVEEIRAMGLPAQRADKTTKPAVNDIVIRGYLVSIVKGDATKRVAIGFGAGESELEVAAEGFQMTEHGLRKLGGGEMDAKGSEKPGATLGVVGVVALHNPVGLLVSTGLKEHDEKTGKSTLEGRAKDTAKVIAGVLKPKFKEQGWIE
ncbi:MAG: DUF4410 domain-containing protein [Gammaproteobacteria bacterium]|nr:DUF4410 domain-containing protein [Gammaproteobacteria bacterium]